LQSVGYDSFDVEHWHQKGIALANVPGQLSATAVAECALMLMFMISRKWTEAQANLQEQRFYVPMGHELEHRRLMLIGLGTSGRELARRGKSFELRISAIDIKPISVEDQEQFGLEFVGGPEHLDMLLAENDYISLHLPLDPGTRQLIDARRLQLMKSSAILINVARGGLWIRTPFMKRWPKAVSRARGWMFLSQSPSIRIIPYCSCRTLSPRRTSRATPSRSRSGGRNSPARISSVSLLENLH
jgi:phosphoglycerate dehydrogenase-like enzyme